MIAVVIPYFQRTPGILRRTLESVLAQDYPGKVLVLVVDDASPAPAAEECAGLPERDTIEIQIVQRPNGGASAARNTGLQHVSQDCSYVAFLDSDDTWSPDHLSRAVSALDDGADLYTANWIPVGASEDAFAMQRKIDLTDHQPRERPENTYRFQGDFFLQELTKPIGRISNLVLRWDFVRDVRFETAFSRSCEDILYRLQLAPRNPVVVFSTKVESRSGSGINQYESSRWGTVEMFDLLRDRLLLCKLARRRLKLSREELAALKTEERGVRRAVIWNALSMLRSGRRIAASTLKSLLDVDARLPLAIPGALFFRATGGPQRR